MIICIDVRVVICFSFVAVTTFGYIYNFSKAILS